MVSFDLPVAGKVTIIVGGTGGVGKTLALGFAKYGAPVVLAARTAENLETVASEIKTQGGKCLAVPTDVLKSDQVSRMVEKTVSEFGRIDVLINCVSAGLFVPFFDISEEAWDIMLDSILKNNYLCCSAVGKVMVAQKSGSIIICTSGAAVVPTPGMVHYCAAKAGLNQFTRTLAAELGPSNVRVNAISPGLIASERGLEKMGASRTAEFVERNPLRRVGKPEDILGLAIFLASEASSYITGDIIPVSGGPQG